jgi:hypothetical protein
LDLSSVGKGYREADAKHDELTLRQWDGALAKLRTKHRLCNKPDTTTKAQHCEDYDLRNPVAHAAGWLATITLDNGQRIRVPEFRFSLDMTDAGVLDNYSLRMGNKVLHHIDNKSD